MRNSYVSIVKKQSYSYPVASTLFRPSQMYPEYLFEELNSGTNEVYDSVREALHLLNLDKARYGTPEWNPLGEIIYPGNCVLIKPNLVMDVNYNHEGGVACLYTQPSVVAAVIDYVLIALGKSGCIIVGDAPMQECDFERLISESGYDKLIRYYADKGYDIRMVDFRGLKSKVQGGLHYATVDDRIPAKVVHLDLVSEFSTEKSERLKRMRVTNYDPRLMNAHHNSERHEYLISDYLLQADVIINMPKPKSHRKAGVTAALKNLVGINARKEFLPHHTAGPVSSGGDEYLRANLFHELRSGLYDRVNIYSSEGKFRRAWINRQLCKLCSALVHSTGDGYAEGSWYGNHTISRTIADLNKIALYADINGAIQNHPVRRMFVVADMVIAGDKEGPVAPSPKEVGIIAAGSNPVCFDEVICTLMGFDIAKIPSLQCARSIQGKCEIVGKGETPMIVSNDAMYNGKRPNELSKNALLQFIPTTGWRNHIELQ